LSIPAYVLYRSSHDMVDTLAPEETQAENQPDITQLPAMNSPTPTPYPPEFYEGKG